MTLRNTISQTVRYGLHFVGIWPGTPLPSLHKLYWIVSMALWQFCQYKYIVTHFKSDGLIKIIECVSMSLPYTLVMIKLFIIWMNHSVLCEIISTMEEDCVKYAVIDTNNVISKTADFSHRLTSAIAFLYLASAVSYAAGGLAFLRTNDTMPRELLLKMDLPFEINESPSYELVVAAQILHQTATSFTFGMFGALLVMVATRLDDGLSLLLKNVSAYIVICLEIFVYCCAGEYLNTKSNMIIEAAYQVSWYDLQPNITRQLILLILKSQTGLPLTFGNFSTLSLASFTKIMKASGSYMSVLLAIF
ncbi:uncharacterized protein LOC144475509 isoform X2 [Augochlora pura]